MFYFIKKIFKPTYQSRIIKLQAKHNKAIKNEEFHKLNNIEIEMSDSCNKLISKMIELYPSVTNIEFNDQSGHIVVTALNNRKTSIMLRQLMEPNEEIKASFIEFDIKSEEMRCVVRNLIIFQNFLKMIKYKFYPSFVYKKEK